MKRKTRTMIGLIGSMMVLSVGMFRLLTESFSSIPLLVAYIFAVTGFIGIIANVFILSKS